MMEQGLGPGFTTVATRRSVILSADGLELALTFRCAACWAAASRERSAPPMIPAEVLNRSRRPILPLRFNMPFSPLFLLGYPDSVPITHISLSDCRVTRLTKTVHRSGYSRLRS